MKKTIHVFAASIALSVLLMFTCFFELLTINSSAANLAFYVETDGFSCNGSITYTINLKAGTSISGSVLKVTYNPDIVTVVETNSVEDSNIGGLYTSGQVECTTNMYALGYLAHSDIRVSKDTSFVYITFKLNDDIDINDFNTDFAFYCDEFYRDSQPSNNIDKGEMLLINSFTEDDFTHNITTTTVPATCTDDGYITKQCSCFETNSTEIFEKLGHDFSTEWTIDEEATCTGDGLKSHHCSRCNEKSDITVVEALGHDLVEGVCSGCVERMLFVLNSDNCSYSVVKCFPDNTTEIIIPKTYNSLPVTSISSRAFMDCTNLKSITIPESISIIREDTFLNCTNLTSIIIPDSVTSIGNNAFSGCTSLTSISIPDSVTSIGNHAFSGCTSLTSISIPDSVTYIGSSAFNGGNKLTITANCNSYAARYVFNNGKNADLKHDSLSEWMVGREPTCTENGLEYRTCSSCSLEETRDIPAHGHVYPEKGSIVVQPTFTDPGLQMKVCTICMKDIIYVQVPVLETPVLKEFNGVWVYASGNTIITDYTGLVEYNGSWFYVANGILDWNLTGLVEYYGNYYHVANGALDWGYSGLSYYRGDWFYVTNGVIDWSYTGLTYYYGDWYYVTNGYLDWNVTTLTYFYDAWYYVENGVLNWDYTGLAEFCGNYYHIANGVLDWGYTGLSYYNGNWWYVTNGVIDWNYTGLTNYYGTWYYVTNGFLDWNVTTLTYFCDVWYYVENGQINWNSNTLCYYGDTWYYVKGGTVAWDYTGWVEYYGGWYYITNGWLDWSRQ